MTSVPFVTTNDDDDSCCSPFCAAGCRSCNVLDDDDDIVNKHATNRKTILLPMIGIVRPSQFHQRKFQENGKGKVQGDSSDSLNTACIKPKAYLLPSVLAKK